MSDAAPHGPSPSADADPHASPTLSFIVPAYNEERLLGATLDSIHAAARATGETYEIVVADDTSTDRTAAIASERGARVVAVRCRQIAATRNRGAGAARGEWFVFVDADTTVDEPVIRAAVEALRAGAAGGGAAVRFDAGVPLYARALLPILVVSFRFLRLAAGCFVFCSRSAFAAAGGFDEAYYGAEEIFLSRALRRQGRFVVLPLAVTTSGRKLRTHSAGELLSTLFRLARRGPASVRQRDGLDLWYAERRDDPHRRRRPMKIEIDDLSRPAIHALLDEHLQSMFRLSPPESVHALDLDRLRRPGITFWSAWDGPVLAGCAALKELDPTHGEIKSMRTPQARRRIGAGRALLRHIIEVAVSRHYDRLSLETGAAAAFEPARRLYESCGFAYCGPFGDYGDDPNSVFMTRRLDRTRVA